MWQLFFFFLPDSVFYIINQRLSFNCIGHNRQSQLRKDKTLNWEITNIRGSLLKYMSKVIYQLLQKTRQCGIFLSTDKIWLVRTPTCGIKKSWFWKHLSENQVHSAQMQGFVWNTGIQVERRQMETIFFTHTFQGSGQNKTKLSLVFWSPLCLFSLRWQCDIRGLIWGNRLTKEDRSAHAACQRETETLHFVWCYSEQSHGHCNQSCVFLVSLLVCVCV